MLDPAVHKRLVKQMPSTVFLDESGIHQGPPCFSIGGFLVADENLLRLEGELELMLLHHGVRGELAWKKIHGRNRQLSEAAVEAVVLAIRMGATPIVITVKKDLLRAWQVDREEGFYKALYQLVRHAGLHVGEDLSVVADDRSNAYPKHDEALQVITNNALRKVSAGALVKTVEFVDSKTSPLIQLADVMVGAKNSATLDALGGGSVSPLKRETIRGIAALFGWDDLRYETFPGHAGFNFWHFPTEFTGVLPSRRPQLRLPTRRRGRALRAQRRAS